MTRLSDPAAATASSPVAVAAARMTYRRAVAELAFVQKPARRAPGYTRWVNRRLGRYLAAAAFVRGMTPNQVTVVSAGFTFAAIAVLASSPPSGAVGIAVAILLLSGYALDSADGQLARLRGGGSPVGEWLDHVLDCVKTTGLHLAVAVAFYRSGLPRVLVLLPLGYTLVATLFFFSIMLSEQIRRREIGPRQFPPGSASAVWSLALLPNDFGILALSFVVLGAPRTFALLYGALLAANVLFLAVKMPAWYLELRGVRSAQ